MTFRVNANSCKNAIGTMFLLAATFFVCSTLVSMRSVFADPIVDTNLTVQKTGRQSPRSTANNRVNTARTTASRTTSSNKTVASRGTGATRTVAKRSVSSARPANVASRGVVSRNNATNRTTTNNRAIRARTSTSNVSRVSANGNVMSAGSRAGTAATTTYSYLTSKLYTGSYSNIVDPTTGLISADAYANCMESYYTCMDEICTARSDTKGRCACAGRANNFLEAETALERANEELIKLSGQLSLLIATKGKGKDLEAAFSLTDAEKVMNCVSWKEAEDKEKWYEEHPTFDSDNKLKTSNYNNPPDYCKKSGNSFGFDVSSINGSGSDILAQLKSWADAKDLAKDYTSDDTSELFSKYKTISNLVVDLTDIKIGTDDEDASIDTLAKKWGYKLFEYAHNNVCGRVLDSCFNGIYEGCGTPVKVTDSDGKSHNRCANGATSNCPFNYNSYISVTTSGDNEGDVKLNERGSSELSTNTAASCFGYTNSATTTVSVVNGRTISAASADPYYSLRGPVADARRSIMQKYLLDANSACDVYGNALKQTAQNINYQKIAAEQALHQKRLEFKQEAESTALAEATSAIQNFNECISEIWDCYEQYDEEEKWTTARIKAYCSQVSQVPHCYETMICSPLKTQMTAVIDMADSTDCNNSDDFTENTCRNVVTISEILYGVTGASVDKNFTPSTGDRQNSMNLREYCLNQTLQADGGEYTLRGWQKTKTWSITYYDSKTGEELSWMSADAYSSSALPLTITEKPTKSGYRFDGWCEESDYNSDGTCRDGATPSISLGANASGNKVFYAIWSPID